MSDQSPIPTRYQPHVWADRFVETAFGWSQNPIYQDSPADLAADLFVGELPWSDPLRHDVIEEVVNHPRYAEMVRTLTALDPDIDWRMAQACLVCGAVTVDVERICSGCRTHHSLNDEQMYRLSIHLMRRIEQGFPPQYIEIMDQRWPGYVFMVLTSPHGRGPIAETIHLHPDSGRITTRFMTRWVTA